MWALPCLLTLPEGAWPALQGTSAPSSGSLLPWMGKAAPSLPTPHPPGGHGQAAPGGSQGGWQGDRSGPQPRGHSGGRGR